MMFNQDNSSKISGGQPAGGETGDILPSAPLQSESRGEAADASASGEAGTEADELHLMQTLHHVLAKALFNGYQNEMALPITSAEVPRRAPSGVQPQARN